MFNPFTVAYRSHNSEFIRDKFDRDAPISVYYALLEAAENGVLIPKRIPDDEESFMLTARLCPFVDARLAYDHGVLSVLYYMGFDGSTLTKEQAGAYCACHLLNADPLSIMSIPF